MASTTLDSVSTPTSTAARTIAAPSKTQRRVGWALSILSILFLTVDAVMKIVLAQPVVEGSLKLGYPPSTMPVIGTVLLLCTVLYAVPRTAVVGAVLLTGYLGGAIATHVRVGDPLVSHTLFPIYLAVFFWGGLYLRDLRVRALNGPGPRS
jgi:hypothetical protein